MLAKTRRRKKKLRIGLAAMNFGKLKGMFFTSKKVFVQLPVRTWPRIIQVSRSRVFYAFYPGVALR